jgi:hypothetical protein
MLSLRYFFIETSTPRTSNIRSRQEVGSLRIARSDVDVIFGMPQKQKSSTLSASEQMQFNNMSEQDPILAFSNDN